MSDAEDLVPRRKIFRVELRVGKGREEIILPLFAAALEADTACKGHLVFTPETPLRYKYGDGVSFIAQKMSVPSSEIAGWQEGVLITLPAKESVPEPGPIACPEVVSTKRRRPSRSKTKLVE